ncbi:cytochrome P450 [Cytidiella melzeri]|nr:cytochrome P450 [Cytidiella melzeri]
MSATVSSVLQVLQDNSSLTTALTLAAGTIVLVFYRTGPFVISSFTSPLRSLPGPPDSSPFWAQGQAIFKADNSVLQDQWVEEYGPVITYKGLLGNNRLWTMDTRALSHILTHSYTYQKPAPSRFHLARIVGAGVLVAEEDQHRNQRRVLNPAFGPAQVRELTEIFVEQSQVLRDKWLAEIAKSGTEDAHVDALSWLSRTTLDIIGLAGFNHNFSALNGETDALNEAFNTIFTSSTSPDLLTLLQGFLPFLKIFKTRRDRQTEEAQQTMRRIGLQLIAEKKASIMTAAGQTSFEKKDVRGRDLLTLLIKANMAKDIPENQRLTDEEVLAQVPTFIVAGHETTSTATTWALFSLTQNPDVQRKLRDELLAVPTQNPTMEQLQALPYLDMVVKEVLRHHSPVPTSFRVATKDDVIPCSAPYTDRVGKQRDYIRIKAGDMILIPILSLNRYKPYWGEDAMEFKPERWEHPPEAIKSIPGVYGHILSFLGGPRSCIGYRFSLVEMKALLFTLVRSFEYELDVPADNVKKRSAIVQRPAITGDDGKEEGKLPLLIRPYARS